MVSRELWERTKALVTDALALPADERETFVLRATLDETALRDEVLSLLHFSADDTKFMRTPEAALRGVVNTDRIETPRQLGEWKLDDVLGRGGMGVVYRAHRESDGKQCAIKVLPSILLPTQSEIQRFERESAAVSRLDHAGIVKIIASGNAEATRWFAMELVDGHDLAHELRILRGQEPGSTPILPIARSAGYEIAIAQLVAKVANAIEHAHEEGVIHRDLKPSNVLLDLDRHPKVADFGLARVSTDSTITRTGDLGGTAQYVSPEQARSLHDRLDARSDVWSLGVVLYELLTLEQPFDAPTAQLVARKIALEDPVAPHERNPHVPRALSAICLRAIEKAPSRRYPSMRAFESDLRRFIAGAPVDATLPGIAGRMRSLGRRRKTSLLATAAAVVSASIAITIWIQLDRRAQANDQLAIVRVVNEVEAFTRSDVPIIVNANAATTTLRRLERDGSAEATVIVHAFEAKRNAFVVSLEREAAAYAARASDAKRTASERVAAGANAVRLYEDLRALVPGEPEFGVRADGTWALPTIQVTALGSDGKSVPASVDLRTIDMRTGMPSTPELLGPAGSTYAVAPGYVRVSVRSRGGGLREFDIAPGINAMAYERIARFRVDEAQPIPGMVRFAGGTLRVPVEDGKSGMCSLAGLEIEVPPFEIAAHETTIGEYRTFVAATGHPRPPFWYDGMAADVKNCDLFPVTRISQDDIDAYLEWAGLRLPTHAEWEFAASAAGARNHPWGAATDEKHARSNSYQPEFPQAKDEQSETDSDPRVLANKIFERLRAVGSLPLGNSPEGLSDLFGNASEVVSAPVVVFNGTSLEPHDFDRFTLGGNAVLGRTVDIAGSHGFSSVFGSQNLGLLRGFRCARSVDP